MSFVVEDFQSFLGLLKQHPEWRDELRRHVLTDDFLGVPAAVDRLTEAQQRTDERLEQLAEAQRLTAESIRELIAAQQRTDERMEQLIAAQQRTDEHLSKIDERFSKIDERLEQLAIAQQRTHEQLEEMSRTFRYLGDEVGAIKGWSLQYHFEKYAFCCFRGMVKRPRAADMIAFGDLLDDAEEKGILTKEEVDEIFRADVFVEGKAKDGEKMFLVVEVSWGIGKSDVTRALKRAELLSKLGKRAQAVVAGRGIIPGAAELAAHHEVPYVLDGPKYMPTYLPD